MRARDKEGEVLLKRVYDIIEKSYEYLVKLPSVEFRMQTVRLFIELEQWKPAIKLLDRIVQENDELADSWYMLAFTLFKTKKYKSALECMKNSISVYNKLKYTDIDLRNESLELQGLILKELSKQGQTEEDVKMDDDDDYETVSEEDISGDEEMT